MTILHRLTKTETDLTYVNHVANIVYIKLPTLCTLIKIVYAKWLM